MSVSNDGKPIIWADTKNPDHVRILAEEQSKEIQFIKNYETKRNVCIIAGVAIFILAGVFLKLYIVKP